MDLFVCFVVVFCVVAFACRYSTCSRDEPPCHVLSQDDPDADLFRAVASVLRDTGGVEEEEGGGRAIEIDGQWIIDINMVDLDDSWAVVAEQPTYSATRRGEKRNI